MRFLDPKFKGNRKNYFAQSTIAMVIIFAMSLTINIFIQTAIIASMGATVFILYTMPHKRVSCARYIFGGYTIGIIMGLLAHQLSLVEAGYMDHLNVAVAVGLAIFFMVITNTEHPPATALALGIAIEGAGLMTIVSIYLSLVIAYVGKTVLKRWMIDLM